MKDHPRLAAASALSALAAAAASCSAVGPAAIRHGRAAYAEAIARTNDQQLLSLIVGLRYGETINLLTVSSVTANVRFSANAGADVGFGSDSAYEGNLVPLSGGVAYEENPTISYAPLQGRAFVRQLLAPVPLDVFLLLDRAVRDPGRVIVALAARVNCIANPLFLEPGQQPDPRFDRFLELVAAIDRARVMELGFQEDQKEYALFLTGIDGETWPLVDELFALLGLPAPDRSQPYLVVPVVDAVFSDRAIAVIRRSVFDLAEVLAAATDVPEADVASGRALAYPVLGRVGDGVRIRRQGSPPSGAHVAVRRAGDWYYIDSADTATKELFRLLSVLVSERLAEATGGTTVPLMTVPVSR